MSGCSSGVEHNLAKVGVEGSNPFARSSFPTSPKPRKTAAFVVSGWLKSQGAGAAEKAVVTARLPFCELTEHEIAVSPGCAVMQSKNSPTPLPHVCNRDGERTVRFKTTTPNTLFLPRRPEPA